MNLKFYLSFLLIIFLSQKTFATHNEAGNIIFEQTGEKTIMATIVTFTKASSVAADRDSLTLCWGDGQCDIVARNFEAFLGNDVKHNQYTWTHTYADFGNYTLSMADPNRTAGILNVNYPNSDNVQFYLETTFALSANFNNSPVLLENPVHLGNVGTPFVHIPNAFDLEGDSIAYELAVPMQSVGNEVLNYVFPQDVTGTGSGILTLDETTGTIIWDAPETDGHYVIAIKINEYRNGQLISSIIRDMMVDIGTGLVGNSPPSVNLVSDNIQVTPGSVVNFDVQFDDADSDGLVVTATGGPFQVSPAAEFNLPQNPLAPPAIISFSWATTAGLARDQPYQVVFTAVENNGNGTHWQKAVQILIDDAPLSSREIMGFKEINIAPNPASSFTNIYIENHALRFGKLSAINVYGKIIYEKQLTGNKKVTLDVSNFPTGIYFIKIKNKNVVGTGKLMVE